MMRRFFSILILFCVTASLTGCEGKREIVSDLQEKEANEIIVFLAARGIEAEKTAASSTGAGGGNTSATYSISVPAAQTTEALAILSAQGLPRRPSQSLLDIFAKSGLVSSQQEEQIRYQEGLSEQIASTIRKIDGVIDAAVQISFPSTDQMTPDEEQEKITASVYVKHQGILDDPNSQLITKIKRLVAASVVGLSYNDVTVVADRARFTDVSLLASPDFLPDDEKEYSMVWTVVVAKESVGRFRAIFITLSLIILLLAAFIAWILWKLFPVIQQSGGLGTLFSGSTPLYIEGKAIPQKKRRKKEGDEEDEEYDGEGEL